MDHANKFSRIHAAYSNKFVRNLSEYLSKFVRMDPSDTFCHSHWPWNTSSRMDHANKFSRILLAHLNKFAHKHHLQMPLTMSWQQSIKNTMTCLQLVWI